MRKTFLLLSMLACLCADAAAEVYRYAFPGAGKVSKDFMQLSAADRYTDDKGYGFDFVPSPDGSATQRPFFFSVRVPDGNYRVTVCLGSKKTAGLTTVRAENRRLFIEREQTKRGETRTMSFLVHKRTPVIGDGKDRVRIKKRERESLIWDDKLTLEFNGPAPQCRYVIIERDTVSPTVFLCGNSTVTDQANEPWASWGQMIPRFFTDSLCVANYAESGETASGFISAKRLAKALSMMKRGDYLFVEFGHNDQKIKSPGSGAYYLYAYSLKTFIDEARRRGVQPVLVSPTQRRVFDGEGRIVETHGDYPSAMAEVAGREGVPLIDLHLMTRRLFEAMGVEGSKKALVHYPAGTFPGQNEPLADNTHFNPYGAYQVAKCVLEGIISLRLPMARYIRADRKPFSPSQPDDPAAFKWDLSPFAELEKPDGN